MKAVNAIRRAIPLALALPFMLSVALSDPQYALCQLEISPSDRQPPEQIEPQKHPTEMELDRARRCGYRFTGMEAAVLYFSLSEARKNIAGYWVSRQVLLLSPTILSCIAFAEANRVGTTVSNEFLSAAYDGQLRTIVLIYATPEKFAPENPAFRLQLGVDIVRPSLQKELDQVSVGLWRAGYKTDHQSVSETKFLDYVIRTFIKERGIDAEHLRVWQVNFYLGMDGSPSVLSYQIVDDSGKIAAKDFDLQKLDASIEVSEKRPKRLH